MNNIKDTNELVNNSYKNVAEQNEAITVQVTNTVQNNTRTVVEEVDELAEALKRLQTEFSVLTSKNLTNFNNKVQDLNSQFLNGKLTVEQYEKAISDLKTTFNLESLQSELNFLQSLNELLTGEEQIKNREKISKLKVQIQQLEVNELIKLRKEEATEFAKSQKAKEDVLTSFDEKYTKSQEEQKAKIERSTELIKQSIIQLKDQIMGDLATLMDISAQKELDRLQRLDEAYSKNYDSRKSYIEKTILDEQEKADALEKLDKERLDFEEKRNEKEAQIEKRRAKFDIAMQGVQSLSTVVAAAAKMIEVATAGDGYTLAARITAAITAGASAFGAIGTLIAKIGTLPTYEKGGDVDPFKPFIAGEKGFEVGIGKSGGVYMFQNPDIYKVPEPVQILTHEKSKEYLQTNNYNKDVTISNDLRVEIIDNKRIRNYFKI